MLFTLLDETLQIQPSKVLLVGTAKSAQKNDKIEEKSYTEKIVLCNEFNLHTDLL